MRTDYEREHEHDYAAQSFPNDRFGPFVLRLEVMALSRKHDNTRLEAFSDAVFAFALTLLVVALEVPRSYSDLTKLLGGFLPFGCSFALLIWVWFEHRLFFRRFALDDGLTVALNGALLFVVMFFIYPLKFIFDSWFARFGFAGRDITPMTMTQLAYTSAIYGAGFAALFAMFTLLYLHAYRRRQQLALTAPELFELKAEAGKHAVSTVTGLAVVAIALLVPRRYAFVGPMAFALLGPAHAFYGQWVERRRQRPQIDP